MVVSLIKKMWLSWGITIALSLGVTIMTLNLVPSFQRFQGYYFPVVTELAITNIDSVEENGVTSSLISGYADKLRNCTYQGVFWTLNSPYGVPITAVFKDAPRTYGIGRIHWTALLVGIEPERLIQETYAEVLHSCSGGLVRTRYYIGSFDNKIEMYE